MSDYPTPASDLFNNLLEGGGTQQQQCMHCWRCLVATGDYSPDELETLRKEADESLGKIVLIDADALAVASLEDGSYLMLDCPCNRAGAIEAFLWSNRTMIARYLRARLEAEQAALRASAGAVALLQDLG